MVSTIATTGIPSLLASFTAICSILESTTKTAEGSEPISFIPPRLRSSFWRNLSIRRISFLGKRSIVPSSNMASRRFRRSIPFWMVWKFVSIPPNQRLFTKGISHRLASSTMESWACFLVPTKSNFPPWATVSITNS